MRFNNGLLERAYFGDNQIFCDHLNWLKVVYARVLSIIGNFNLKLCTVIVIHCHGYYAIECSLIKLAMAFKQEKPLKFTY